MNFFSRILPNKEKPVPNECASPTTVNQNMETADKSNNFSSPKRESPKPEREGMFSNLKNLFSGKRSTPGIQEKKELTEYLSSIKKSTQLGSLRKDRSIQYLNQVKTNDEACEPLESSSDEELEPQMSQQYQQLQYGLTPLNKEDREEYLIILVHGIGTTKEYQDHHLADFKRGLKKVRNHSFSNTPYKYIVRMIDWNSIVSEAKIFKKINKITIMEGSQSIRVMMNEVGLDVLLYLSPKLKDSILQRVADEANRYYEEIYQMGQNSKFRGKVSFVGHSLGTVITYDLLMRQEPASYLELEVRKVMAMETAAKQKLMTSEFKQQLFFPVEHYYMLGSPLGIFVSVYNEDNFMKERLPTCKHYYNIFHPQDPVAYRIEPLFNTDLHGEGLEYLQPVMLPYYKNNGYRIIGQINQFIQTTPVAIVQSAQSALDSLKKQYVSLQQQYSKQKTNRISRLSVNDDFPAVEDDIFDEMSDFRFDFCIQGRGLETIITPVGLLNSHVRYFKNKDVINFILKKIHQERKAQQNQSWVDL